MRRVVARGLALVVLTSAATVVAGAVTTGQGRAAGRTSVPSARPPVSTAAAQAGTSLVVGLHRGIAGAAVLSRLHTPVLGTRPLRSLHALQLEVPPGQRQAALDQLRADPDVRFAEVDATVQGMGVVTANDPYGYLDTGDGVHNRVPPAWSWTTGSTAVVVAVLDSGVTPNTDLNDGRVLPGYDFVNDDADPSDDQGHGTLVADVTAGIPNNKVGRTGVCWQCRILPVKVLQPTASGGTTGSYSNLAAGIVWAADHDATVINVSAAGSADSQLLRDAVAHATAAGAVIVAAAGDRNTTAPYYPAAIEPVIAVGATGSSGKPLVGTNTNPVDSPWIDLVALGYAKGVDHQDNPLYLSGTSVAAPVVAGTAALIRSARPDLTPAAVRDALTSGSRPPVKGWTDVRDLDAGNVLKTVGPADTEPPVVEDIGLPTDGTLVCGCARWVEPIIRENRDIVRTEMLTGDTVLATSYRWTSTLYWTPTNLNGPVPITIRAYDSSGNIGEKTATVTFDTTLNAAITTPAEYTVVDGPTPITVTGDPDITLIDVDNQKTDTTGTTGPWTTSMDFTTKPNGHWYQFGVLVRDRAGNTKTLLEYVGVDHDTPVVTLDDKQLPAVLHGPVELRPTVVDNGSLVQLTLLANDKVVDVNDWHWNYLSWPEAAHLNGIYTLTIRAVDEAGHHSTDLSRTVRLDNAGPAGGTVTPANRALIRGTVQAAAIGYTDPSRVAQAQLYLDNKLVRTDTSAPYRIPLSTGRRNGPLHLKWVLTDTLGNTTVITSTPTADNQPPKVAFTAAPKNDATVKGTLKITASAADTNGIARVQLLINGKVVGTDTKTPYTFTLNTKRQPKKMTVQIRAYDRAGNLASTTKRWRHK